MKDGHCNECLLCSLHFCNKKLYRFYYSISLNAFLQISSTYGNTDIENEFRADDERPCPIKLQYCILFYASSL